MKAISVRQPWAWLIIHGGKVHAPAGAMRLIELTR